MTAYLFPCRRLLVWAILAFLVMACGQKGSTEQTSSSPETSTEPHNSTKPDAAKRPSPGQSAKEVVVIQLEALMDQREADDQTPYATAYAFLSPSFREMLGGWEGFVNMMQSPTHAPMREFEGYKIREHFLEDGKGEFFVSLQLPQGKTQYLQFRMVQSDEEADCPSCWLTARILPLQHPPEGNPHERQPEQV
jgi:hypothetical protein